MCRDEEDLARRQVGWRSAAEAAAAAAPLDNRRAPPILTLTSNQSLLLAFPAVPGCHCLKITVLPPLSCLINKSDVQFRNFAINLLKYCWRMLIVMPVAIKAHLHNLCVKNNYEAGSQTQPTKCSQLRMRGPQKHFIHCSPKKKGKRSGEGKRRKGKREKN